MEDYINILILAVIQGAAELLPVPRSASGIFAMDLMKKTPSDPKETFLLIMLHTGTMFAVIVYFWPRWRPLLLPPRPGGAETVWQRHRFLWLALLATALSLGLY